MAKISIFRSILLISSAIIPRHSIRNTFSQSSRSTLHFRTTQLEISEILGELNYDYTVLQDPVAKIDANIVGRYLEHVVLKTGNSRIGLETGFLLPFILTGIYFNIHNKSNTLREIYENEGPFDPAKNDIHTYAIKEDDTNFIFEISIQPEFRQLYPVASRQWLEMQFGIFFQYAYSFLGRFLYPVAVYSIYGQEGENEKLKDYVGCPVVFNHNKQALVYNKSVLDLPIITGDRDMLTFFEDYMNEIRLQESGQNNNLTRTVRRFLTHSLINVDLSLNTVAERFNMSPRNMQRKLKSEGTSYQKILDDLRIELSQKYLRERIPFTEIGLLLGFESQSAFNKFFQKHFHTTPGQFK